MSNKEGFKESAEDFDVWWSHNQNIFESELLAMKRFITDPKETVSIGTGAGWFSSRLGIPVGVEPSEKMAKLARDRGIDIKIGTIEDISFEDERFSGVLFDNSISVIDDLKKAFQEAYRILKPGGHVVVPFLPKEGGFAQLYMLAEIRGRHDPDVSPAHPYPIKFIRGSHWYSTTEVLRLLEEVGFTDFKSVQTLTTYPKYANDRVEGPIDGHDRGSYVIIHGVK